MIEIIGGKMKKRIILGSIAILLTATTLVGCNSTEDATVTKLSNELDKTNNSISNVKTLTETDLKVTEEILDKLATQNQSENVQRNIYIAQNAIQNEQNCKNEVMAKTANIKKYLSQNDLKLAKNQVSALKDLSKNLSVYNNSISYSEREFNSAIKNYNNIKKSASKNPDSVNAKLNRIACNSNARCAYYENLLNTLDQVENVLGINPYNNENYEYLEDYSPTQFDDIEEDIEKIEENTTEDASETPKQDKPKKRRFKKNIDTYLNEEDKKEIEEIQNIENLNNNIDNNNNSTYNYNSNNSLGRRNLNNYNTDTYGPTRRNIDTYRPYNYSMPYNNGMNGTYGYNTPYNPYMNGAYPNGMYNYPYGYNSNTFNRMATPYVNTDEINDTESLDNQITEETDNNNKENIQDSKKINVIRVPKKIKDKKMEINNITKTNLNNSKADNCEDCKNEVENINDTKENINDCENCSNEIKKPRLEEFENEEMKIKEINASAQDVKYIGNDEERVAAN